MSVYIIVYCATRHQDTATYSPIYSTETESDCDTMNIIYTHFIYCRYLHTFCCDNFQTFTLRQLKVYMI